MDLDPIVVEVKQPKTPFKLPFKLPQFGNKSTKIITIVAAIVIILSIAVFVIFTALVNNDTYRKKQNIVTATDEIRKSAGQVMGAAIPGNNEIIGKGGGSGPDQPKITLIASAGTVDIGSKVSLRWEASANAKSCVASEDWSGEKPLKGSEDSANLTNLTTYTYILTCKNATSTGYSKVDVTVQQRSGSGVAGQPVVNLSVAKPSVYTGQSFSISWTASNNPTSCTASGDWSGTKPSSGSEAVGPFSTVRDYSFKLTCSNAKGSGSTSTAGKVIAIPPDPVVTIEVNPSGSVDAGTSANLTWSTLNYSGSCTASGDWSGTKNASGSQSTGILSTSNKTYNFRLDCSGAYDIASVTAVDPAPTITSFTASASNIYTGSAPTISWSSANTSGTNPCSLTLNGTTVGAKPASGSNVSLGTISSAGTYTYGLVCSNGTRSSAQKTVVINASVQPAPVVTLIADSYSVAANGSTNVRWSSTNSATSCTASGDWTGSKSTTGTTTSNVFSTGAISAGVTKTYNLSCSNANPTPGTASITVSASSGGAVSAPVVTISLSPASIAVGASSTINWSVANTTGTTCTASGTGGWTGSQGMSGSTSTGAKGTAGSYTYTLACSNSAGSDTKTATLTVNSLPTVSISLSAATVEAGTSVNLTWSSTNTTGATPCTASGGWSGAKGASGTSAITAPNPASPTSSSPTGTTTYTVSCSNASGSTSQSTTLTSAYCYQGGSVRTPCYGPTTMNTHATAAACWNYWKNTAGTILTKVYNIAGFNSVHSGKGSVTLNTTALCGNKALNWSLPGFPSNSKHSAVMQNNSQSTLNGYAVGYYDANSPN